MTHEVRKLLFNQNTKYYDRFLGMVRPKGILYFKKRPNLKNGGIRNLFLPTLHNTK